MVGPKSKEPAGHDELKSAKAQEQSVLTAQTSVVFESLKDLGDVCPHIAPRRLKYLGRRIARE